MAVFTAVTEPQLIQWMRAYDLGEVVDFRGIASGIENSNFFLTTTRGQYVLTIFEKLTAQQLPFYLDLMRHLAARRVPVPDPVPRADGALAGMLLGKPATIVTKLDGAPQLAPRAEHCAEVGQMLARMHLAGRDFASHQPNLRSLAWWQQAVPAVLPFVDAGQRALLAAELAHQQAFFASGDYAALPGGPCHCDLFRDNVLFTAASSAATVTTTAMTAAAATTAAASMASTVTAASAATTAAAENTPRNQDERAAKLGGFFDFYFAGCDKWLFDVAVTVNDWCTDPSNGRLDAPRADALLRAYQRVRAFAPAENRHWHDMLRAGAYRFWVSRLYDFYLPRSARLLTAHDPGQFERILRERIASAPAVHPR